MYRASAAYLNLALRNLARFCETGAIASVALPKIGAGLGKLDWEADVRPLLQRHLAESRTLFLVYDDFKIAYETENSVPRVP